ncbi:hypothetical protein [Almyronema epifaneia]|uniref:Uncharacterized protein n=1 Tax=Almyronema epifaneia S1 TaxID=2991925 RepID=A0ABW6IA41_9CYAN
MTQLPSFSLWPVTPAQQTPTPTPLPPAPAPRWGRRLLLACLLAGCWLLLWARPAVGA